MRTREKAVFDCNIYLQALGNEFGASGRCLHAAFAGQVTLFVDRPLLVELFDVVSRPVVTRKLRILPTRVDALRQYLLTKATLVENVPEVFHYARDPDDARYVNLAIATDAMLVVSRDLDLLDLMSDHNVDGLALRKRFPDFQVLSPSTFLKLLPPIDES